MINQADEVYEMVSNKLRIQMDTDDEFKMEMQRIYFFYERKLMGYAKTEAQRTLIIEGFEEVVFSQFFQGYYVMKSLLLDEETILDKNVWSLGIGLVRNETPKFIAETFKEEGTDWTKTEIGQKFGMEVLQHIEPAFEAFKQIRLDIVNYGVYKAFIEDDRYKPISLENSNETVLGNVFDLEFLSPQVYMQAQFFTDQHEIWDLFMWSSIRNGAWVGSVHYSTLPVDEQTHYLLEITLMSTISKEEKMDIANQIINRFPEDTRVLLQTRLYHVEDYDVLVPSGIL